MPGFMAHSVQDAIRAAVGLRRRIGKARMNVVTKAQEFIRCVYGTNGTRVQIIAAYVCQECGHAPKYDFDYIVLIKCGSKSEWYCTCCGCMYGQPWWLHCPHLHPKGEAGQYDLLPEGPQLHPHR